MDNSITSSALQTIEIEANSISQLKNSINKDFVSTVEQILKSKGRVVVSGIGKSAIIANKIVATLNSTGTPAIFMHAADAIHGDLGIIQPNDIVICLSKSGNTPEIKALVPLIKHNRNTLIAMVGNLNSYLALQSDLILDTSVEKEACPNNLAPTSSSTAQLVMGDALAVSLLNCRGFTSSDFARYHPGGALGKRLYLKVADLCSNNPKPLVSPDQNIKSAIIEISSSRLGAVAVVKAQNELVGIITDGDLRRMLERDMDIKSSIVSEVMTKNPKTVEKDVLATEALEIMREKKINQLIVTENGEYIGIIHIQDLVREGLY